MSSLSIKFTNHLYIFCNFLRLSLTVVARVTIKLKLSVMQIRPLLTQQRQPLTLLRPFLLYLSRKAILNRHHYLVLREHLMRCEVTHPNLVDLGTRLLTIFIAWMIKLLISFINISISFSSSSKPSALSPLAAGNRAFPRGSANRSTFHSGQTRERRSPFNGATGNALLASQDTSSVSAQRSSFFSKLSSKFSKR